MAYACLARTARLAGLATPSDVDTQNPGQSQLAPHPVCCAAPVDLVTRRPTDPTHHPEPSHRE